MFDLGRGFLASVERGPDAVAIVGGEHRRTYAEWYAEIGRVADGLAALSLRRGDRLAVILQNRIEMASVHWACQFLGIVMTPLNWRLKAEELDYCLADAGAGAVAFDAIAIEAIGGAVTAHCCRRP
jgi:2-furoate---CoA ligase